MLFLVQTCCSLQSLRHVFEIYRLLIFEALTLSFFKASFKTLYNKHQVLVSTLAQSNLSAAINIRRLTIAC